MSYLKLACVVLLAACFVALPPSGDAYSVQTHEQLIDLAWKGAIVPLLKSRFPRITPAELQEAHAYAYGGSAVQDLGYYPFGHVFFSDLTHYVRPGFFVESLLRQARTPDELAFAVGALSHFLGDVEGHSVATNPSVAMEFPKLRARFGPSVTYEDNPHAHVRTEFGFDLDQIGHRRFAPAAYLEHVGLNVSQDLMARAFADTYGIPLREVLGDTGNSTLKGYRFAVRHLIPRVAYAELLLHRTQLPDDTPGPEFAQFQRNLAQSEFENGWDQYRRHPGIGTHLLAGLLFAVPKIGSFKILAIKVPNSTTEELYVESVNRSITVLRRYLDGMHAEESADQTTIANRDLDTGSRTRPGDYRLTDQTYAQLLERLTKKPERAIPAGVQRDVLHFYADPAHPPSTIQNPKGVGQGTGGVACAARDENDCRSVIQVILGSGHSEEVTRADPDRSTTAELSYGGHTDNDKAPITWSLRL